MKLQYNKYVKVDDTYTFGYRWVKKDTNERQLLFGKSGKGYCVGITYSKSLKMAFKDNSGYFKTCNEENNLPQGKEGTYRMIYAAIRILHDRYPDAKLLSWQDNTMITINGKYDISLSDSDTILYGKPRIIDIVGEQSIKDKIYRPLARDIVRELCNIKHVNFEAFWKRYYSVFSSQDIFRAQETKELKTIYKKSKTLLSFFQDADKYLTSINKKKWIFLPLRSILTDNNIESFVGTTWVIDTKKAVENVPVKVVSLDVQKGGGIDMFDVVLPKTKLRHVDGPSGDILYINSSYYFLDKLEKCIKPVVKN